MFGCTFLQAACGGVVFQPLIGIRNFCLESADSQTDSFVAL
jgi:hypothetical protein